MLGMRATYADVRYAVISGERITPADLEEEEDEEQFENEVEFTLSDPSAYKCHYEDRLFAEMQRKENRESLYNNLLRAQKLTFKSHQLTRKWLNQPSPKKTRWRKG